MRRIDVAAEDLRTVIRILRVHIPDRRVLVFGSRATGRAKPFSDLDLAVIGETPLLPSTLARIADDFDESSLPFKVDVVDWASTAESFRKIIERDALALDEPLQIGGSSGMSRFGV